MKLKVGVTIFLRMEYFKIYINHMLQTGPEFWCQRIYNTSIDES